MTDIVESAEAARATKAAHRALWASGDYPAVAQDVIHELGPILVRRCGIQPGDKVLDVAAGSGNAALAAAAVGAHVVASDLTPELFAAGQESAAQRGLDLQWQEADAEDLPFGDGEFDTVMSCVGVMFAPHHERTAGELIRVIRPGGSIGLVNWTPAGFIGRMFGVMKQYAAAPPAGSSPPPLWGDPNHVRELFGDRVVELDCTTDVLTVDNFPQPQQFLDFFKAKYGPTIAIYRRIADDPAKVEDLDAQLLELAAEHFRGTHMEWEYLTVTARKAG